MATNPTKGLSLPFAGFSNPNGTIVPDEIVDVLMPQPCEAELRVLLSIVRRTFGFKKSSDDISLKQMVEGITTKDGRVLDRGTDLGKSIVARHLAGLRGKGIVLAVRNRSTEHGNEATTYRLRFKGEPEDSEQGARAAGKRDLPLLVPGPGPTTSGETLRNSKGHTRKRCHKRDHPGERGRPRMGDGTPTKATRSADLEGLQAPQGTGCHSQRGPCLAA